MAQLANLRTSVNDVLKRSIVGKWWRHVQPYWNRYIGYVIVHSKHYIHCACEFMPKKTKKKKRAAKDRVGQYFRYIQHLERCNDQEQYSHRGNPVTCGTVSLMPLISIKNNRWDNHPHSLDNTHLWCQNMIIFTDSKDNTISLKSNWVSKHRPSNNVGFVISFHSVSYPQN